MVYYTEMNLTDRQKVVIHSFFTIIYGVLMLWILYQTYKNIFYGQMVKLRAAVLISLGAAVTVILIDNISSAALDYNSTSSFYALCFIPYAYASYFIYTAYFFALFKWIEAYRGSSDKVDIFQKVLFALDILFLIASTLTAYFFCASELDRGNTTKITPGRLIYLVMVIICSFCIAFGFLVYGIRIALTLRAGIRMRAGDDAKLSDDLMFKTTVQTAVLSFTTLVVGIVVFTLLFLSRGNTNFTAARAIQYILDYVLIFEMVLMVRAKDKKKDYSTKLRSDQSSTRFGFGSSSSSNT